MAAGAVASAGVAWWAGARTDDALALQTDAVEVQRVLRAATSVREGLVALALDAPGGGTPSVAEVRTRVGELSALAAPVHTAPPAPVALEQAELSRRDFVEAASDALDRSGGDPAQLATRLPGLSRRHAAVVRTWSELEAQLAEAVDRTRSRTSALRAFSLVVLAVAAAAAAASVWWAARTAARRVDRPVERLRGAVGQLARGERVVRIGLTGQDALAELGRDVELAAAAVDERQQRLRQQAEWGAQSRMIFEALDLVEDESEAHEVAQQALALIDADRSMELLLAPHGSTAMTVVATNPGMPRPACPVEMTTSCVAVRRAQPVVYESSESINACPKLRNRSYGACSAACVPVSIAGRPVGVLHTIGPDRDPPGDRTVNQLATLATQLGNRLGALRALESSRVEASTDKLTGLPNRRMLESQLGQLIERGTPFVLVLADLDKFKRLNDTYGHEVGDRALQTFAQVLRDKVRGNDVIARLGGEEFVLVYPNMSVTTSIEAIERIRDGLAQALAVSALPEFTCSFGITHSSVARSAEAIIRVADAGLLRAKELGGDQVVYADETLAAQMFGDDRG
jgi:diguanylate cyclase (GGDEF)-like protein